MNWLAHLFLSEQNTDHQLGNLLCDPCKGRAFEGANDAFKQGLKMHMSIDAFTDSHASFLKSKQRLNKKGHLKGVVIDLTYDVFLTQFWSEYCDMDLNTFLDGFYLNAPMALEYYPSQPRAFVERLIQVDHLRAPLLIDCSLCVT
jgi:acyl carrier protein phosphodiesterase